MMTTRELKICNFLILCGKSKNKRRKRGKNERGDGRKSGKDEREKARDRKKEREIPLMSRRVYKSNNWVVLSRGPFEVFSFTILSAATASAALPSVCKESFFLDVTIGFSDFSSSVKLMSSTEIASALGFST